MDGCRRACRSRGANLHGHRIRTADQADAGDPGQRCGTCQRRARLFDCAWAHHRICQGALFSRSLGRAPRWHRRVRICRYFGSHSTARCRRLEPGARFGERAFSPRSCQSPCAPEAKWWNVAWLVCQLIMQPPSQRGARRETDDADATVIVRRRARVRCFRKPPRSNRDCGRVIVI